jgi:hypothetical protein
MEVQLLYEDFQGILCLILIDTYEKIRFPYNNVLRLLNAQGLALLHEDVKCRLSGSCWY